MMEKTYRKCTSRNKNGRRWGIEFPLQWVEELGLKEEVLELVKNDDDDTITIKKIGTQQHKQESDYDEPLI